MSVPVLLKFIKQVWKIDKMRGLLSSLSLFRKEFNKFNKTGARMLDFINHYDPKTAMKSRVLCENAKILSYICDVITDINTYVNHERYIDFNAWHYITTGSDVIW